MTVNVTLLVLWIVLLSREAVLSALAIGTVAFAISLVGISFYLFLTIKEIQLNRRQANFVDSVTHELKTPIASLRLYLETLQLRDLDYTQRTEFYDVMENELTRLDSLINQLLEVGRLDAIGQDADPEDIDLEALLRRCAETASGHHKCDPREVFTFNVEPTVIHSRPMLLEMIFGNLMDNAVKYSGKQPRVDVSATIRDGGRIEVLIEDNGEGVDPDMRKKIFRLFHRGGDELRRTTRGTGLGLYIVRTLVHLLKGHVVVRDREGQAGSVFEVELLCQAREGSVAAESVHDSADRGSLSGSPVTVS